MNSKQSAEWNEQKRKLKERLAQVMDDDLLAEDKMNEILNRIQKKTVKSITELKKNIGAL